MPILGTICRLTTPHGPQVGDLNIWSLANPRERFWASRTRQLHASHVSVGDRLWSNLPYLRPLVTITGDSLKDYGLDDVGGRCHDLLGTRCDPYGTYIPETLEDLCAYWKQKNGKNKQRREPQHTEEIGAHI